MSPAVIGGWEPVLEAALYADSAVYDTATYDSAGAGYDGDGQPQWVDLRCQLLSVDCHRGAAPRPGLGAVAEAGRLNADFHDPEGLLDPTAGAFGTLLNPGSPVRLSARRPDGSVSLPVWTGTADAWTHDLLDRTGTLTAADGVARLSAVPVISAVRPAETAAQRVAALVALAPDPPPLIMEGTGRTLAACTLTGDLWQVLASVVDTDGSQLWFAADGTLMWRSRGTPDDPVAVLTDCPDGDAQWDAVYIALSAVVDEDLVVNIVEADRVRPEAGRGAGATGAQGPAGPSGTNTYG